MWRHGEYAVSGPGLRASYGRCQQCGGFYGGFALKVSHKKWQRFWGKILGEGVKFAQEFLLAERSCTTGATPSVPGHDHPFEPMALVKVYRRAVAVASGPSIAAVAISG